MKTLGIILLFIWSLATGGESSQTINTRAGDEAALEDLYRSANGSNWTNNNGWSSSGMSLSNDIYGVKVASIDGELRVTEINLRDNGLTGSIDNASLGNLTEMKLFAVYWNALDSRIPAELISLPKLTYLYLSLTGNLSDELEHIHPHDFARTGSGEIHIGKSKGSEGNIFRGALPAPANPSAMSLKWFILNWTDSAEGAADGISSIPVELFNISTFVGLQIFNNNNIADMPFPLNISNMTNIEHLALGAGKSGRSTGFLTGSVPVSFRDLINLRYLSLDENPDLIFDFDNVVLTGMKRLRNIELSFTDIRGTFPSELTDGTMPNLVFINISWPTGPGVTGSLACGGDKLQALMISGHSLSEIPGCFWNHTQLINTNFSHNNLTAIGTDDLTHLGEKYWKVRNLRWTNNLVNGRWPNLAWGTERVSKFSRAHFDNNKYVFSDMLWVPDEYNPNNKTIFELYKDHGLSSLRYGNQKPFGQAATIGYSIGGDITLDDFIGVVTHPDNSYQWQKDGVDILGATSPSLTISNAGSSDLGTYRLMVTNPGVPDLILTSAPIEVTVQ